MNRLVERVSEYMQEHHMVEDGQKIVVGVSGGADSMGLLSILSEIAQYFHLSLVVVHVNHGLRGKAADADQVYVENVCRNLEIPCYSFHVDLKRFARKEGMSEEEAGRYYRYQCFEKVRKEVGAHRIAVAHQREDTCETVLFNMFRGTGLKGLTGIPPVRDEIIRPLLCVTRSEIEAYLQEKEIEWRTDETNLTDVYTRNKIRHQVIPYVEEHINSAAGQHIQETAGLLSDIEDYLNQQTDQAFDTCVILGEEPVCAIHGASFAAQHVVIQREILRRAFYVAAGKLKDVDKEHIEMVRNLFGKTVGRRCSLPYHLQAIRTYEGVSIRKVLPGEECPEDGPWVDVTAPGHYRIPDSDMTVEFEIKESFKTEEIPINRYTKWFDYDTINNSLSIRTRENGDYITLDSQGHRKPLKRWMIDEKIPREERDRVLLLADGHHILWIIGHRISESYKVTSATQRVLAVKVRCETYTSEHIECTIDRERNGYSDVRTG